MAPHSKEKVQYPSSAKLHEDLSKKKLTPQQFDMIKNVAISLNVRIDIIILSYMNFSEYKSFEDWHIDVLMIGEDFKEKPYQIKFQHQGRAGDEPSKYVTRKI